MTRRYCIFMAWDARLMLTMRTDSQHEHQPTLDRDVRMRNPLAARLLTFEVRTAYNLAVKGTISPLSDGVKNPDALRIKYAYFVARSPLPRKTGSRGSQFAVYPAI